MNLRFSAEFVLPTVADQVCRLAGRTSTAQREKQT